ncbi:MAG: substrate-binding domain-containing protein, partial [Deltaproteobacteria bacterium]|nr:substrate-binding domain-containing protein [Deltaproteobacteria bacterium]
VNRGFIDDYNPQTDITAHFITVIITPKGNPKQITKIEDFKRGGLRIGLADPEAAAIGLWHEKTFKKAGIWDAVKQNATMYAKCIPELGNAVQLGAIDATIVWATTAVLYLKDIEIVPIEPQYRGIIRLPIALLKFSQQPTFAKKIKAFILSDEGKKIFHSHAYGINAVPTDDTGFCTDNGQATTDDMKWLVAAAKVAKDPSIAVTKATVGHLVKEVLRQRQTLH